MGATYGRTAMLSGIVLALLTILNARGAQQADAHKGGQPERADITADPHAMPYYTGRICPTPQKVAYQDDFFPLSRVRIVAGKDVENPGPLIQVLVERIRTYGGAVEPTDTAGGDFTTLVSLGQTDIAAKVKAPSVPDREQAYVIACGQADGRNVVVRFPLHPYDKEHFGTARKADFHILGELDKRLRAEFPHARIMIVPPFYWGPLGGVADWYGEPRDPYLEEIGKLPASVEIQWTGPRVKSTVVKKEYVDWIIERIRRKPVYWQKGWGTSHPNYEHYVAEPVRCWPEWYYDGFLQDISCHTYNAAFPQSAVLVATIADYCWNPMAYDPARSVEEAARKLVGPQAYGALEALSTELTYFDQFGYNISPGAARFVGEMAEHAKAVERFWSETTSKSKAVESYSSLGETVKRVKAYVEGLKANPALGANAEKAEEVRKDAVAETNLDEKRDAFLSPYDFIGGLGPREYSNRCPKRLALWLYGAQSGLNTAKLRFTVDPFPPAGDYLLVLSGQDDDLEKPCGMRLAVNGKVIVEGGCPFARNNWSRHTFRLPAPSLKPSNELVIEVTDPGPRGQPPWLMVNYAVLRRTGS